MRRAFFYGAMAEWFIAAVSKTDDVHASVGSNPTGSAIMETSLKLGVRTIG